MVTSLASVLAGSSLIIVTVCVVYLVLFRKQSHFAELFAVWLVLLAEVSKLTAVLTWWFTKGAS